jgi:hypothetical protein
MMLRLRNGRARKDRAGGTGSGGTEVQICGSDRSRPALKAMLTPNRRARGERNPDILPLPEELSSSAPGMTGRGFPTRTRHYEPTVPAG